MARWLESIVTRGSAPRRSTADTLPRRSVLGFTGLVLACLGCADETPPQFASGELTFAPTEDHLEVGWPHATDDRHVDAYIVRVDGTAVARVGRDTLAYTVEGVRERTSRALRVTAVDASGNESAPLEGTYAVPDRTPPSFAADARLTAASDEAEVTFRWSSASDEGALQYRVFVGEREIGAAAETTLTVPRAAVGEAPGEPSVVAIDDAGLRSTALRGRWVWNLRMGLATRDDIARGAMPVDAALLDRLAGPSPRGPRARRARSRRGLRGLRRTGSFGARR